MSTLINIIHPDTFKAVHKEEGLFIWRKGECPEHLERDKKVSEFVYASLEKGSDVLNHRRYGSQEMLDYEKELLKDPLYKKLLADDRIRSFYTQNDGLPLSQNPPDVPESELHEALKSIISHKKLRQIVGIPRPDLVFFIGGFFEQCMGNFSIYYAERISEGEMMFCIPEFCVSAKNGEYNVAKNEMAKAGIRFIRSEEAMKIIELF